MSVYLFVCVYACTCFSRLSSIHAFYMVIPYMPLSIVSHHIFFSSLHSSLYSPIIISVLCRLFISTALILHLLVSLKKKRFHSHTEMEPVFHHKEFLHTMHSTSSHLSGPSDRLQFFFLALLFSQHLIFMP